MKILQEGNLYNQKSPALDFQAENVYPVEWSGKVPAIIRLVQDIESTLEIRKVGNYAATNVTKKLSGNYQCVINSVGKCFIATNNEYYLLLNSDEFEVLEWHSTLNIPAGIGQYA